MFHTRKEVSMMEQLGSSSVPFQAIRVSHPERARLSPADWPALSAIAARCAIMPLLSGAWAAASGCVDYDFLTRWHAAFSKGTKASQPSLMRAPPGDRPVRRLPGGQECVLVWCLVVLEPRSSASACSLFPKGSPSASPAFNSSISAGRTRRSKRISFCPGSGRRLLPLA